MKFQHTASHNLSYFPFPSSTYLHVGGGQGAPPTPEKRDVVYRPLRFPQADRQDSHGSGMPEQLPPNLGEKQDPWANLEVLPSLHVASVVQVSLREHW